MKNEIRILGIETSCDETAAAVIAGDGKNSPHILSNVVASQVKIHAKTGGIVPEVAARAHAEKVIPVIQAALEKSSTVIIPKGSNCHSEQSEESRDPSSAIRRIQDDIKYIDAIAVTIGPGLIGSLLIGVETAKTLSYVFNKPIIPINHLEGHIYSNFIRVNLKSQISNLKISFPALCLIVSGGHTSLTLMKDHGKYQEIGSTRDDAAGEAFDKVAKLLGLSYPGGPSISKAAEEIINQNAKIKMQIASYGNPPKRRNGNVKCKIKLPRPMIDSGDFDFSFSGLKTAVLYLIKDVSHSEQSEESRDSSADSRRLQNDIRSAIAAEFQQAVIDVLTTKTLEASKKYKVKTVILGGGVAANKLLRKTLRHELKEKLLGVDCWMSDVTLSTDNAAMIAAAGYYHYIRKNYVDWRKIRIDANLKL